MCVIKTIKEGSFSSREILEMWNNNPDGAGIGVLDKSNTLIKPFKSKDFNEFQINLDLVFRNQDFNQVVIHFRRRSRGSYDLVNVNPIPVNKDTLFFHNGTFGNLNEEYLSDSNIFVRDFISEIKDFDLSDPNTELKILNLLNGNTSRMVFLQTGVEKPLIIDNANIGYWDESKNIWTSNREH